MNINGATLLTFMEITIDSNGTYSSVLRHRHVKFSVASGRALSTLVDTHVAHSFVRSIPCRVLQKRATVTAAAWMRKEAHDFNTYLPMHLSNGSKNNTLGGTRDPGAQLLKVLAVERSRTLDVQ